MTTPKPETPKVTEPTQPEKSKTTSKAQKPIQLIPKYRLDIYQGGTLKPSVRTEVMLTMSRKYGDIMRAVSPTKWMTLDEICEGTWYIEKKLRLSHSRTRKEIETAIQELLEAQFIIQTV